MRRTGRLHREDEARCFLGALAEGSSSIRHASLHRWQWMLEFDRMTSVHNPPDMTDDELRTSRAAWERDRAAHWAHVASLSGAS